MGDSQRDSRESIRANRFAIETPMFIARQADSHESLEFPIHANHATKVSKRVLNQRSVLVCDAFDGDHSNNLYMLVTLSTERGCDKCPCSFASRGPIFLETPRNPDNSRRQTLDRQLNN